MKNTFIAGYPSGSLITSSQLMPFLDVMTGYLSDRRFHFLDYPLAELVHSVVYVDCEGPGIANAQEEISI